jgi:hypothetical protein
MTMTESQDALAHLAWQVELGADEAILDAPVNRFDVVEKAETCAPSAIAQAIQTPAPPVKAPAPASDKASDTAPPSRRPKPWRHRRSRCLSCRPR